MPEHYCKNCKKSNGNNTCSLTGALHTTGIECPSFRQKESEMFKVGDRVRVIADAERLGVCHIHITPLTGKIGCVDFYDPTIKSDLKYRVRVDDTSWNFAAQDLELVEEEVKEPVQLDSSKLTVFDACPKPFKHHAIRTFDSGATRDTDQGKLDYLKALSPIVLRRYVQYLDKHRLQPDGSYRDFDNWKKGVPPEAYISGSGRHFMDTWLLTEGYATEDNHGPVELQDAICAQLFNLMGRLHEMLEVKVDRIAPTEGSH